jgi:hypothetical protein
VKVIVGCNVEPTHTSLSTAIVPEGAGFIITGKVNGLPGQFPSEQEIGVTVYVIVASELVVLTRGVVLKMAV